jgi:single-strand selective monofunctional uracil DNA glycosylase
VRAPRKTGPAEHILASEEKLCIALEQLRFSRPVTHVYNPLRYAREPHVDYIRRYALPGCEVLLLGMNPGPWGMAQTGVPFGEVSLVRDWLGIRGTVEKPLEEHPRRPVLGFHCARSEVSGARLWGWARERFASPANFFARFFVYNYCPLAFMDAEGRNFTPDKLPVAEARPLIAACDENLREVVAALSPRYIIGVGGYAARRLRSACHDHEGITGEILHPSPASPAANRGWAPEAEAQLRALGIDIAT